MVLVIFRRLDVFDNLILSHRRNRFDSPGCSQIGHRKERIRFPNVVKDGVPRQPGQIAGTLRNMWPHDPARTGMAVSSSRAASA